MIDRTYDDSNNLDGDDRAADGDRAAGHADGDRRKRAALDLHESHREQLIYAARQALVRHALACGTVTADDVRDLVELPPGVTPKAFGAVPGPLAKSGIIERAGYTETCRPMAHARPVSVWRLRDRSKAEQWLVDHPDRPRASDAMCDAPTTNETGPAGATAEPVDHDPHTDIQES